LYKQNAAAGRAGNSAHGASMWRTYDAIIYRRPTGFLAAAIHKDRALNGFSVIE